MKTRFYLYVLTKDGLLKPAAEYARNFWLGYYTLSDYGYSSKEEAITAGEETGRDLVILEKINHFE